MGLCPQRSRFGHDLLIGLLVARELTAYDVA